MTAFLPLQGWFLAHGGGEEGGAPNPRTFADLWHSWAFEDPTVLIGLTLSAWLYARGLRRAWALTAVGRGIRVWEAGSYAVGWLALAIALVSPLHPWGRVLFSAHMIQHELLMLVAAPLMVLGRPIVAFLAALPKAWAGAAVRATNAPWWRRTWLVLTNALAAWLIHAVILWVWHAPVLMDAVLHNEFVHAVQHVSFLGSALLFWWAVIQGGRNASGYGIAVLYLFTTAIHSGLLGVLITVARHVLYPSYVGRTDSWGLTALEDQQIGGLIMWIPACTVYIIAGIALFAGWMREAERRVAKREAERARDVPSATSAVESTPT